MNNLQREYSMPCALNLAHNQEFSPPDNFAERKKSPLTFRSRLLSVLKLHNPYDCLTNILHFRSHSI